MLTLYDYLPSLNAYKVRLLLHHLEMEHSTEFVSIFEGSGQRQEYLTINPTGAVPAIRLDDGQVIAESNAILCYLAEGTRYLPDDRYSRAKVFQWMFFEQNYLEPQLGSLRYWTMTGKLVRRSSEAVESRRSASLAALFILERELAGHSFIAGEAYTIADMSIFAYAHRADEACIPLSEYPRLSDWIDRVRGQANFLDQIHPYSIDPYSTRELPPRRDSGHNASGFLQDTLIP
jgi:glutathione S-transferase